MISLPVLRQSDPKWGAMLMGTSGLSLAQDGCLETCASMALANFSVNIDPGQLCLQLNADNGYDQWGNLKHEAIPNLFVHTSWWDEEDTTNTINRSEVLVQAPEAVHRIANLVNMGQPTPVRVAFGGHPHWILAVDPDFKFCHDPGFGDVIDIRSRYGPPETAICGFIALVGEPVSFPDGAKPEVGGAFAQMVESFKKTGDSYAKNAINLLIG